MFGISFLFVLVLAIFNIVGNATSGNTAGGIVKTIISSVVAMIANMLIMWNTRPYFEVFPYENYFLYTLLDAFIFGVVEVFGLMAQGGFGGVVAQVLVVVVMTAFNFFGWLFVNPQGPFTGRPFFCAQYIDETNANIANILKVKESESSGLANVSIKDLPQISPDDAIATARQLVPTDISSWIEVAPISTHVPFLEMVNGKLYYHVEMQPRYLSGEQIGNPYQTFTNKGGMVPGHVLVSATDRTDKGIFVKAPYRYAYGLNLLSGQNVDDKFYREWELPNGLVADDKGIEQLDGGPDADGNSPIVYTAAILAPTYGLYGKTVVGALTMNPNTGEFITHSLDMLPSSIDRIVSEDFVRNWASNWGQFSVAKFCPTSDLDKRLKIDRLAYAPTSNGLMYQITMTDESVGERIAKILYVSPRTGDVTAYSPGAPLTTLESIDTVLTREGRKNVKGFSREVEANQCIIVQLLGETVVYCLMQEPPAQGKDYRPTVGFAMFKAKYPTKATDKVIFAQTLEGAYAQLQRQTDSGVNVSMSATTISDIYTGTVEAIGTQPVGDQSVYNITLVEDTKRFYVADAKGGVGRIASLTRSGVVVTMTGNTDPNQPDVVNVNSICAFIGNSERCSSGSN